MAPLGSDRAAPADENRKNLQTICISNLLRAVTWRTRLRPLRRSDPDIFFVIENSQIGTAAGDYAACSRLAGSCRMSQMDEVRPQYQHSSDAVVAKAVG